MIKYVLLSIILIYLSLWIFIKVKFRFWSIQPVFHVYNLKYWISPPGILQHDDPPKTKYFDPTIDCHTFQSLPTEKKDLLYYLVKNHYLTDGRRASYNPPKTAVLDYFLKHNDDAYITLNFENFSEPDWRNKVTTSRKKLVSAMTSRTLECSIHGKSLQTSYVDFLCVHKSKRKQGVAPRTIYTHYVKSRQLGAPAIFLFKREGDVNFMVPLTVYYAYAFPLKYWSKPNFQIPNTITCSLINAGNSRLFYHYLNEVKDEYDCFITPAHSHLQYLIEKQLLFICLILDANTPVGCYIFRNPYTSYNGQKSVELIASHYSVDYDEIFVDCFENAIVLVKQKVDAGVVVVENISKNNQVIRKVMKKGKPLWECPMAYYFYNFIYRPFSSKNVFLLN